MSLSLMVWTLLVWGHNIDVTDSVAERSVCSTDTHTHYSKHTFTVRNDCLHSVEIFDVFVMNYSV